MQQRPLDIDELLLPRTTTVKIQTQQQQIAFPQSGPEIKDSTTIIVAPKEKVQERSKVTNTGGFVDFHSSYLAKSCKIMMSHDRGHVSFTAHPTILRQCFWLPRVERFL